MLAGGSFRLAEIRRMSMPEINSFVAILTGKHTSTGKGRRIMPMRRKGR